VREWEDIVGLEMGGVWVDDQESAEEEEMGRSGGGRKGKKGRR
jgi:hypothetical protein